MRCLSRFKSGNSKNVVDDVASHQPPAGRKELLRLVNKLPAHKLDEAKALLQAMIEPEIIVRIAGTDSEKPNNPLLEAVKRAPVDDEPETPEEAVAVEHARQQASRGEIASDVQVRYHFRHEHHNGSLD